MQVKETLPWLIAITSSKRMLIPLSCLLLTGLSFLEEVRFLTSLLVSFGLLFLAFWLFVRQSSSVVSFSPCLPLPFTWTFKLFSSIGSWMAYGLLRSLLPCPWFRFWAGCIGYLSMPVRPLLPSSDAETDYFILLLQDLNPNLISPRWWLHPRLRLLPFLSWVSQHAPRPYLPWISQS